MNREDVKKVLWIYRPGSPDELDPEVREALGQARQDPELGQWLQEHGRRQVQVRQQLQRITVPVGLKERILAEHQAREKIIPWPSISYWLAAAAVVAVLVGLPFWLRSNPQPSTGFARYQTEMAAVALRGYAMELNTHDAGAIRQYLGQHQAPDDFVLPSGLQQAVVAGCAIESWQGRKAALVCFRTGQPLPAGAESDLWLFVIDQAAVTGAPANGRPVVAKISRLNVATWSQAGKLYVLSTTANAGVLQKFL